MECQQLFRFSRVVDYVNGTSLIVARHHQPTIPASFTIMISRPPCKNRQLSLQMGKVFLVQRKLAFTYPPLSLARCYTIDWPS